MLKDLKNVQISNSERLHIYGGTDALNNPNTVVGLTIYIQSDCKPHYADCKKICAPSELQRVNYEPTSLQITKANIKIFKTSNTLV